MIDFHSLIIRITIFLVVSTLLVVTGLRKEPGLGILGAILIIAVTLWLRRAGFVDLGFAQPADFGRTVWLAVLLGIGIQLLSVVFIEPLSERITRSRHDHSVVDAVKGSWAVLVQWLLIVWLTVAVLEEGIYRGFLMTEFREIAGDRTGAVIANVLITSTVFGLSHGYQNRSGILSTGIIGVLLGLIFVWSEYNLWLPILTHGFIDTVGIGMIALGWDRLFRRLLWGQDSAG